MFSSLMAETDATSPKGVPRRVVFMLTILYNYLSTSPDSAILKVENPEL